VWAVGWRCIDVHDIGSTGRQELFGSLAGHARLVQPSQGDLWTGARNLADLPAARNF
jgi:hypothetical protein